MKNSARLFVQILFLLTMPVAFGQSTGEQLVGSWLGKLDVAGTQLRIVFNISQDEGKQLSATMDSPDQGAKGIGMGEVILSGDSLTIEAPVIMGQYKGVVTSDSTIEGEWSQRGLTFKLDLKKQATELVLNRPQEPHPPYPYREEEVTFFNKAGQFSLGGTLTLPEGEGPYRAIVLVTGSGSQDRDETLFGHKPFKVIADYMTRRGIAVLRYDDRGVGSSGGSAMGSTTADNATDAEAAFDYLSQRPETDPRKMGILGHSEGGMIAMMLAAENQDVDFIISLAGPGVDGKTIILDQSEYISRLSGVPDEVIKSNRIVMTRIYDLMASDESYGVWKDEVIEYTNTYYGNEGTQQYTPEVIENIQQNLLAVIPESAYPWMRYFVMFDPSTILGRIHCPVLALNGDKDCEVMAQKNIDAIREKLVSSGNQDVTAMVIPGLNHLFQPCETGLPAEYGIIETTFDPKTLEMISQWISDI